jgi:hypothetical protein
MSTCKFGMLAASNCSSESTGMRKLCRTCNTKTLIYKDDMPGIRINSTRCEMRQSWIGMVAIGWTRRTRS